MSRPFRFSGRNPIPWIALLAAAALAVRLPAWPYQSIVTVDGTSYIRVARMLLGGPHYLTAQPPGYPALMAPLVALLGGDGVDAARLTSLLCGVLLFIPFFLFARRSLGAPLAFLAGLVPALTPLAIRYSVITMSEIPYLAVALLAVLAAASGRSLATGLLSGAAFHVRPEGIILAGFLALVSGWKPRTWLLVGLGFLLAGAGPALVYNRVTAGEWTLTRKGVNVASDDPARNEYEMAHPGETAPADLTLAGRVARYGDSVRRAYPGRLAAEFRNLADAVGWPMILVAAVGLLAAFGVGLRRPPPGEPGAADPRLAAAGLAQILFVPLFPGVAPVPRLILPLLPFVAYFALLAARRLGRRWGAALGGVAAAGWLVAAVPDVRPLALQEDGYYPELVRAGLMLKPVVSDTTLVFDRKPYTAFYAGARYQQTPLAGYHATLEQVIAAGGDYLVVDEAVVGIFRPELTPLIRDSFVIRNESRLEPVLFDPSLQGRHTLVYRVVRPGGGPPADPARAERIRQATDRLPHDPKLHALHAEILWLAGRREEALAEYEAARAAGPLPVIDAKNMARLILDLGGDPARAVELLEAALREAPGRADLLELLTRARRAIGPGPAEGDVRERR